jgi:hypothetical protein
MKKTPRNYKKGKKLQKGQEITKRARNYKKGKKFRKSRKSQKGGAYEIIDTLDKLEDSKKYATMFQIVNNNNKDIVYTFNNENKTKSQDEIEENFNNIEKYIEDTTNYEIRAL